MARKKSYNLSQIWHQVPVDYYDQGLSRNILQWLWHTRKTGVFFKLMRGYSFRKILDLGCASGTMTAKIAHHFPGCRVVGVDVYQDAIDYATTKYPKLYVQVADAHQLPFANSSFDLVVCYETIEHVSDPPKVLSELRRVLKKNGTAVVAMDSGSWLFKMVWWFWEKTKGRVWQGAHLHPFHYNELQAHILKAGFVIRLRQFSHLGMEVVFVLGK